MDSINLALKISDIMQEIVLLETAYEQIGEANKPRNILKELKMSHIHDKIETLRLLISFVEPASTECLSACLATGYLFADRSNASEENHQTKEDWRAFQRCPSIS